MNRDAANAHLTLLGYECRTLYGAFALVRASDGWRAANSYGDPSPLEDPVMWLRHGTLRSISDIRGHCFWPIARKIDPSIRRTPCGTTTRS